VYRNRKIEVLSEDVTARDRNCIWFPIYIYI